ncbi:MAG: hypothetical protein IJC41_07230 [Firmicutes bacterium]|nr:hypothetical protein [Clostridiales bacterium]MBQ2846216.1 hypothetical protein [Bacillota bacterium]MBQ4340774.1 hypothetical protein [Bacillota bacterium]
MKKYLSVIMLSARSSIYKVFPVMILMIAAQYFLFSKKLSLASVSEGSIAGSFPSLEMVIFESRIMWVLFAAFLVITFFLCRTGCEFKNKQGYTLKRLRISEKGVFFCQALYNSAVYLILWGIQIMTALWFCHMYMSEPVFGDLGSQTVFAAFYRNDFMHSILPLAEFGIYIRNAVLAVALGAASAVFPYKQRMGKIGFEIILLTAACLLFFVVEMGSIDFTGLMIMICLFVTFMTVRFVMGKEDEYA